MKYEILRNYHVSIDDLYYYEFIQLYKHLTILKQEAEIKERMRREFEILTK